jgi:AraC-like DNA-binding protein
MPAMTWGFATACRAAGVVIALLLVAVLLRDHPRDRSGRASVFLLVGVAAHLTVPLLLNAHAPLWMIHGAVLAALSVPFAFWLLAEIHFDDDFSPSPVHASFLVALLAVGYVSWLAVVEHRFSGPLLGPATYDLWALAPRLLGVALVVHATIRIYVGARSDLVLPRLRLRYGVLVVAGTYILVVLVGEFLLRDSPSAPLADTLHSAALVATLFAVAFLAFRIAPQVLKPAAVDADTPVLDPKLLERLKTAMEADEVFREEGLTIRGLADRIGTQEHKLRELINAQLGFKNFNAFLHHYRIREAEKSLTDPSQSHMGVAQIAYEVGYRSLATFNKAFKELTGRTPTERRESR